MIPWDDSDSITYKGAEFIDPQLTIKETTSNNSFTFNNGDFRGAGFGSEFTINNEWNEGLEELKNYVKNLPPEDKEVGEEIIDIVEKEELKPSILNRFASFIEKHPNMFGLIGKSVVWTLTEFYK